MNKTEKAKPKEKKGTAANKTKNRKSEGFLPGLSKKSKTKQECVQTKSLKNISKMCLFF